MFAFSRLQPSLFIRTISIICMVFLDVLLISGCSILLSKDKYIKSFSAFVTDVKTNGANYIHSDRNKTT